MEFQSLGAIRSSVVNIGEKNLHILKFWYQGLYRL